MLTRKQIRKMKQNKMAKKAITTSALAFGMGLGLAAIGPTKVDAATWTANSVESIQSALKTSGTTPYTIKWGDTLSTITEAAKRNGIETSVSRLTKINKIANADLIYAGNKLWFNASNGTVTGTDKNGNDHTYNLNPNKPVTGNGNVGSTGASQTPTKPSTPGHSNGGNGSNSVTNPATPSKPGNSGSNNGGNTTKPSTPSKPGNNGNGNTNNPGGNDNGNGNTNNPGNGGDQPGNGGEVTPPTEKIYRPNATDIKQDLMSLINLSANGKYWGVPTGKAPSGEDWISTEQHLSASGNGFKSDMDVAKELYKGFIDWNLTDPSYVSAVISSVVVTGSTNYTNPKHVTGMINVSDVTMKWYSDPFYGE